MSNSLDPDQARRFVGPDLGPHCLQSLSADDTSRQRVEFESLPAARYEEFITKCTCQPKSILHA